MYRSSLLLPFQSILHSSRLIIPRTLTSQRHFTSAALKMTGSAEYLKAIQSRRSIYAISNKSPISDDKIVDIVEASVKHSPSSFNVQSSRAVLLLGDEHIKHWTFVKEAIKAIVPAEAWPSSETRLNGFQGGYGTVLLFEDNAAVEGLQAKLPLYADRFPTWAEHASGILAFNIWTALELEGFGASLQHYNPLADAKIAEAFNIPASWSLKAQVVFGQQVGEPGEKAFQPIEDRVKVFGK